MAREASRSLAAHVHPPIDHSPHGRRSVGGHQYGPRMDDKLTEIKAALGKPFYEAPGVLLYLGDCLEVLGHVQGAPVDLTVTSPPYNIGKAYERPLPLPDYLAWCGKWMTRVHEVTQPHGAFWLNVGYVRVPDQGRAVPLPYLLWDKSPFWLHQEVVWQYGAGVTAKRAFAPRNEKWLWYLKDPNTYTFDLDAVRDPDVKYPLQMKGGKLRCNPLGKNPGDVWTIKKVTSGAGRAAKERTSHPAQFPEAVVDRVILSASRVGDVVLDPFLGSGTTGLVARRRGRAFVGVEIREDYLELAVKRLETPEQLQAAHD